MVDSSALGERLDPETLQLVLDSYFSAIREVVEHHGGRVEKYIGDAVVALFGIPTAHEDDAVRAGRAALDIRSAMTRVNADLANLGVTLRIRIGVQSGDVVVDPRRPYVGTIGGDPFNTAARLQAAAAPDAILVGAGTAALLAGWADLERLPVMELKGKKKPEAAFVLAGVGRRSRALGKGPFVGRSALLGTLHGAFQECVDNRAPFLVTLLGMPGIGKSRAVDQIGGELATQATVLVGLTPAYGEAVAYAPIVGLLQSASAATDPEEIVSGLRAHLGDGDDDEAVVDRLSALVDAHTSSTGGDTAWALRRLLESMARERPVVVVVEDIHFGGDALLDLLDRVVTSARGPIMVLCTGRPELLDDRPSWGRGPVRTTSITLGPLPSQDADDMARHLLAGAGESVRKRLTAAAEGNPLYLEQLAAMMAENGTNDATPEIPPSLRALLAARLDRLGPVESRVVNLAAVEGRQFHPELISVLDAELSHIEVLHALHQLEYLNLVALADGGAWRFVHALIQEAATLRTAKEERAVLHVRMATHLAAAASPTDEVIAAHLERAARLHRELGRSGPETVELERTAGERLAAAGSRAYANVELTAAAELLGRATGLLPQSDPMRTALIPDLGVCLMEIGRTDEAERLLSSGGNGEGWTSDVQQARIRIQLLALRGVYRAASVEDVELYLEEGYRIADRLESLGDQTALAQVWTLIEYLNWVLGRISDAVDSCVKAVRAAQAAGRTREQMQAGGDLGLYLASGYLPVARVKGIVAGFDVETDPIWRLVSLASSATSCAFGGDLGGFDRAQARWSQLVEKTDLVWPAANQAVAIAQARLEVGDAPGAEQLLRLTMSTMERLGDLWAYSAAAWMLPRAVAMQGRHEEALTLSARSARRDRLVMLDVASRVHDRFVTALSFQIRGSWAEAEAASRTGAELAAGTDLAILHTCALEQLAEIVDELGRKNEARQLRQSALAIHDRQGNVVGAARVTALLE